MTEVGKVYGEAMYSLACEEGLEETILYQLKTLDNSFSEEPDFIRLLGTPNLSKTDRCRILDDSFRGKADPYVLNFLKILTEKGHMQQFHNCVEAYSKKYNRDNGILPVTAVTACPLANATKKRLAETLHKITGKQIVLVNNLDPALLGGVRLDYDGKRVEDTVSYRLDAIRNMLKNTVL